MSARLFLFYGTDSRASRAAVLEWERLFAGKHGEITRYVIEADELPADRISALLNEYIEGQSLFDGPKFIVLKRVASSDRAPSYTTSKTVVATLQKLLPKIDDKVTVVIWDSANLTPTHPLLKEFTHWKEQGLAGLKLFTIPTERTVVTAAQKYLEQYGKQLSSEAAAWLQQEYATLGRQARLAKRLRAGEELLQDERSWWLYQLLDTVSLGSKKEIEVTMLQENHPTSQVVGVFDVATAVANRRYLEARRLMRVLEQQEGGDIFSLLAALRWQMTKIAPAEGKFGLQLLAEAELILKNFSPSPWWMVDVLLNRLEQGEQRSLMSARRLWLAHLQRS